MDQTLIDAAATGNVTTFHELIERDGNVLRRIDEVEFIDTPLHTAAENGCIEFAMEIMNLKPSFARKLNHQGMSPLHLAVEKGQVNMALCLMEIDKELVRVRGKNGETPLHYLSKVENQHGLLDRFVDGFPEGIRDVTSQNRTALHIAVENNKPDVLKVLIRSIRKKDYYEEVVNRQDEDGNTALLIAAKNNQTEMLKLLLKCKADKHVSNHNKKTALDVAHDTESIHILRDCFSPKIIKSLYELKKKMVKKVTKASSLVFHGMDNISDDDRNALLVILGLLLTITYTATLSPPGGLWQGDSYSNFTNYIHRPGSTVMDQIDFLYLYVPTYVAFIVTFFLTLALLKPYPSGFRAALQVLLAFLALCFDQSVCSIAPTSLATWIIRTFSIIVFILMMLMSIAYQVSKVSVLIVGCYIIPIYGIIIPGGVIGISPTQGLLLFILQYDNFVEGTILAVCYSFYLAISVFDWLGAGITSSVLSAGCFIGWWLFLNASLFCIKRFMKGW